MKIVSLEVNDKVNLFVIVCQLQHFYATVHTETIARMLYLKKHLIISDQLHLKVTYNYYVFSVLPSQQLYCSLTTYLLLFFGTCQSSGHSLFDKSRIQRRKESLFFCLFKNTRAFEKECISVFICPNLQSSASLPTSSQWASVSIDFKAKECIIYYMWVYGLYKKPAHN